MKVIGIMGALDLEIELIKNSIDLIDKASVAGFEFYVGKIDEKDIVLTCCGVGKVNAACCTQILIDRFNVNYIINTGIAGGLNDEFKVCDVVISSNVTHHDVRKRQMESLFPFQEYFEGDKMLIAAAVKACKSFKDESFNYHVGRIVSGECFVSDNTLKKSIIEEYSPYCVEMEGSAIGHVAHINGVPFVVIRSISDNADDEATISYDAFEKISAKRSAAIVLNMIKLI